MNKKLLLATPLLALGIIASMGKSSTAAYAKGSYDFFPEQDTVLTSIYYSYNKVGETLVKNPAGKTVYERYDNRLVKSETSYFYDEDKKDFDMYEKYEYTYDEQGNILTLKMYRNDNGETKYDGGYFYTYENGKVTLAIEHDSKDEECGKVVYTYTSNSKKEQSYIPVSGSLTLSTERTYTYDSDGKALTRHFIYYSYGTITRQSMIYWTYDAQNRRTREEEKFYNGPTMDEPYNCDLTDFTYGDGVFSEIFYSWENDEYVLDDKNVYTTSSTVMTEEHFDYVSDKWELSTSTKETATFDENGFRTKVFIEYKDDENPVYEAIGEFEYEHIELPSEETAPEENKSSAAGIILGVLGGLIIIIVGLFTAWKIEVKKVGIDSTKRFLKFLDKVCVPVDNVIFPVKSDK